MTLLPAFAVCPTISLSPASPLPGYLVNVAYSQTITASGGTAPYTFAVTVGTLPPVLTLSGTGTISGTPTAAGTYVFTIEATDSLGCKGSQIYTLRTCGGIILDAELHAGVNAPVNSLIRISEPALVSTLVGPIVPPGCAPPGSTEIEWDAFSNSAYGEVLVGPWPGSGWPFDIFTGAPLGPCVPTGVYFTGLEAVGGVWYGTFIPGVGGPSFLAILNPVTGIFTFIGPTGLPPGVFISGLAYDPTSGIMYGVTGGPGSLLVNINLVTGAAAVIGPTGFFLDGLQFGVAGTLYGGGAGPNAGILFVINPVTGAGAAAAPTPPGDITGLTLAQKPVALANGNVGVSYPPYTITPSGGVAAYTFSVSAGFPPGLTLGPATGTISGTPTTAGPYSFVVTAKDVNACAGSRTYSITIDTSLQEASPSSNMIATKGPGTTVALSYVPACGASDHVVYWGTGPIGGALSWTNSACGLGTTGSASFDPATPAAGNFFYFVIVGQDASHEGSYGQSSGGAEEPEAVGVGACDQPQFLGGTCP